MPGIATLAAVAAFATTQAAPPAPDAPLPTRPGPLAAELAKTHTELGPELETWDQRDEPPEAVTLLTLHQQRIYRRMARNPGLARRTIAELPGRLRPAAREIVGAMTDLRRLTPPTKPRKIRLQDPRPAAELMRYYRAAQKRFGVGWHVLAAVNFVESAFGRLRNDSVAGAQGPMQFIPSTWAAFGMGGDVQDPRDAIMGAANYLKANGAPRNYPRALFRYNPSPLYVSAVRRYARRIARGWYLPLYAWQVWVRVPGGERRVTGPMVQ